MYEYKSMLLIDGYDECSIGQDENDKLNDKFKKGWEYVDSICQGGDSTGIIVILRKKKEDSVTL